MEYLLRIGDLTTAKCEHLPFGSTTGLNAEENVFFRRNQNLYSSM
ncbi:MAG: hypothetical protein ACFFC7_19320 [Candidatus Hermodarchaeota archaeon]